MTALDRTCWILQMETTVQQQKWNIEGWAQPWKLEIIYRSKQFSLQISRATLWKSLNLYILTVRHGVYCRTLSHNASLMKLRVQINTCSNAFMHLVLSTGPSKHMSRLSRWRRPASSNLYLTTAPYIGIYWSDHCYRVCKTAWATQNILETAF